MTAGTIGAQLAGQEPHGARPLVDFALNWAARGIPLVPLVPMANHPAIKDWPNAASTDPDVIREWFSGGQHGIGGLTGQASGLLVIDVDTRHGDGRAELAAWLEREGIAIPDTTWAETPNGGWHIYLQTPAGEPVPTRRMSSVDFQGDGVMVALPPTRAALKPRTCLPDYLAGRDDLAAMLTSGMRRPGEAAPRRLPRKYGSYQLAGPPRVAQCPPGLLEALRRLPSRPGSGNGHGGGSLPPTEELLQNGVSAPRDTALAALAARLVAQRVDWPAGLKILRTVADLSTLTYPWTDDNLRGKWDSAVAEGYGDGPDLTPDAIEWAASTRPKAEVTVSSQPDPEAAKRARLEAEAVYARWLHDADPVPTRLVLAAYAANAVLAGDPVWVMLVGGSGIGKTERITPISAMPHVVMASTITGEAALLSASPKRERAKNATGGLLRQVGDRGVIVVKDFSSVLSMSRDRRAEVVAALREVYDGRWDRHYGTDGGQVLTWQGHCGFIAGCTTAIDGAHAVLDQMGTRFLFVRLPDGDMDQVGRSALAHAGQEAAMRAELAEATARLLASLGPPHKLHDKVSEWLVALARLASLSRSPVDRDYQGEISLILDSEAPSPIIKQLGQLWKACGMLGLDEAASWQVVRRAGLDSIPKLRRAVIEHLAADSWPTTPEVARGTRHPLRTTRRALEDLEAHGIAQRRGGGPGLADRWDLSEQAAGWWQKLTVPVLAGGDTGAQRR